MEKITHDAAKDPDAVLHFAQELDSASTEDVKNNSRPPEPGQPSIPSTQEVPATTTNQTGGKEEADEEHHDNEADEDEPGLVARMTAKGALWGF